MITGAYTVQVNPQSDIAEGFVHIEELSSFVKRNIKKVYRDGRGYREDWVVVAVVETLEEAEEVAHRVLSIFSKRFGLIGIDQYIDELDETFKVSCPGKMFL